MDFLWSVIRDYFVCLVTSVSFLVFLKGNELTSRRTMKLFRISTYCVIVVMCCEILGRYLSLLDYPTTLHVVCSVISYELRAAIPFFIALIPLRYEEEILCFIASIPLAVEAIFLSTAFYSDVLFYYDENNHFVRGPLGIVPFIIGALYILVVLLIAFIPYKRGEKSETKICFVMAVTCSICVVVEAIQEMSGLLLTACVASEIFYYIYFIVNRYSHDPLTEALFGKRMYQDIAKLKEPCAFILIDVNGLKRINNEEGHDAGDEALASFGRATNLCLPSEARFYRIGGDEFAILYKNADEIQVSHLLTRIREKSEKLQYDFSFGYAFIKTNHEDIKSIYAKADAMLDSNKEHYWNVYHSKHGTEDAV